MQSFPSKISVSRATIYKWVEKFPEFAEAKEIGEAHSQLFWEKLAIDHVVTADKVSLNASVWIFNMKNRFGWRDKQKDEADVVVNNYSNMSDEELEKEIEQALKNYKKQTGGKNE